MSVIIDKTTTPTEQLQQMDIDLHISVPIESKSVKNYKTKIIELTPYRIMNNLVFIPMSYGIKKYNFKPMKHNTSSINYEFIGTLRPEQKIVRNEAIDILNKQNSVVISTHVGFGKSILATYFMSKIQMKTLIIVNRLVLINQWVEVLHKFIKDPKISIMKPNQIIDWDNDFFIVNAINIAKFGYMPEIGLVVVDELHLIVSKVLSNCFQYLTPNYLIGLSATPYRPDGLDVLINLYFGEERIDRQLFKKHHVYVINTNFTPIINKNNNNSIDWNDILNQQSQNEERNDLIINCILKENYNFLVLCKRVEHIKYIGNKLRELDESKNINIQCLYNESQPNTNVDETQKQVIIGTIQKIGTGFDFPCLNALIIAADIEEYFIQYLGRIFRKQHECIPVVFDFVDNNSILQKHFKTRKKTYQKHGGTISIYSTFSRKDI